MLYVFDVCGWISESEVTLSSQGWMTYAQLFDVRHSEDGGDIKFVLDSKFDVDFLCPCV